MNNMELIYSTKGYRITSLEVLFKEDKVYYKDKLCKTMFLKAKSYLDLTNALLNSEVYYVNQIPKKLTYLELPDKTKLFSLDRHDLVSKEYLGELYFIDGGQQDYIRTSHPKKVRKLSYSFAHVWIRKTKCFENYLEHKTSLDFLVITINNERDLVWKNLLICEYNYRIKNNIK